MSRTYTSKDWWKMGCLYAGSDDHSQKDHSGLSFNIFKRNQSDLRYTHTPPGIDYSNLSRGQDSARSTVRGKLLDLNVCTCTHYFVRGSRHIIGDHACTRLTAERTHAKQIWTVHTFDAMHWNWNLACQALNRGITDWAYAYFWCTARECTAYLCHFVRWQRAECRQTLHPPVHAFVHACTRVPANTKKVVHPRERSPLQLWQAWACKDLTPHDSSHIHLARGTDQSRTAGVCDK